MHIAAVMSILDLSDLDQNAKMALLVVACRADRYTAMAEVSIGRVATDMGVGYHAATNGLDRARQAGYLAVDKSPGRVPMWRLTSAVCPPNLRDSGDQPPRSDRGRRSKKDIEGSAAAPLDSGGAGENLPPVDFAGAAARLRLIRNGTGA